MELKRIKKQAQLKLKNKLCNKICACEDKRRSYRAKREIALRDTQRHPYNDREEQRWYIDRNCNHDCAYNNKHQTAKRPRFECPGYCNRKEDHCNNQPKKLGHERPKSNGKVLCPIHSFPDTPEHSWADCSDNPANQRKQAPQSTVRAHHTAVNNCYLSNDEDDCSSIESDHMEAVNNQSLNRHSLSN